MHRTSSGTPFFTRHSTLLPRPFLTGANRENGVSFEIHLCSLRCLLCGSEGRVSSGKQDTGKTEKRIWYFHRDTSHPSLAPDPPATISTLESRIPNKTC